MSNFLLHSVLGRKAKFLQAKLAEIQRKCDKAAATVRPLLKYSAKKRCKTYLQIFAKCRKRNQLELIMFIMGSNRKRDNNSSML